MGNYPFKFSYLENIKVLNTNPVRGIYLFPQKLELPSFYLKKINLKKKIPEIRRKIFSWEESFLKGVQIFRRAIEYFKIKHFI